MGEPDSELRQGDGVVDIELDKDDDQPKQDIQYHAYSRAMHQQVINTKNINNQMYRSAVKLKGSSKVSIKSYASQKDLKLSGFTHKSLLIGKFHLVISYLFERR